MKTYSYNGAWNLSFYEHGSVCANTPEQLRNANVKTIAATVPGNVELDLIEAGLLPRDIFRGRNIEQAETYESYDWWYETEIDIPAEACKKRAELYFHGVDCFAEYFLNGEKIGESRNMLIPHAFNIDGKYKVGKNTLSVKITSPIAAAAEEPIEAVNMAYSWMHREERRVSSLVARKAPHSYGWDIMPRAVSAGIWKDVELRLHDPVEFKEVSYFILNYAPTEIKLRVMYWIDMPCQTWKEGVTVSIKGVCDDSVFEKEDDLLEPVCWLDVTIPNPKLWWPYGYGEPNLYETELQIRKGNTVLDTYKLNIGLRKGDLIRTDVTDGINGNFQFRINDTDIMCKGTNWVPLDPYHSRDKARLAKATELLKDSGSNMIRCWGGNVYPSQELCDFCDKNGIMMWVDFVMGCAYYPRTESFLREMSEEAEIIVRAYRNHPAIVLWAGDNENDSLVFGKKNKLHPDSMEITHNVLGKIVERHDPARPYLPSSPFGSEAAIEGINQGLRVLPEDHLWGPRNFYKDDFYTQSTAHFVSETGYHGCPSVESLKKFLNEPLYDHIETNEEWRVHSSNQFNNSYRVRLMQDQNIQLFGKIGDTLEEFVLASQISQAEAKKFFVERIRIGRPHKTGILWWNLLDGWPQESDAVVDYYYDKKLAYGYIKRCQAPVAVMVSEIRDWGSDVIVGNDTLQPCSGHVIITDADTNETVFEKDFSVGANGSFVIGNFRRMFSDKRMLFIRWTANGKEGFNHYLCGMPGFDLDTYRGWVKKMAALGCEIPEYFK